MTLLAARAGLYGGGPFNLGRAGDFRVPDAGLFRERGNRLYVPTAALVVEIVSPGDETGRSSRSTPRTMSTSSSSSTR